MVDRSVFPMAWHYFNDLLTHTWYIVPMDIKSTDCPKVMIFADSWRYGGPFARAERLAEELLKQGSEVIMVTNNPDTQNGSNLLKQYPKRYTIDTFAKYTEPKQSSLIDVFNKYQPDAVATDAAPFSYSLFEPHDRSYTIDVDKLAHHIKQKSDEREKAGEKPIKLYTLHRDNEYSGKTTEQISEVLQLYDSVLVAGDNTVHELYKEPAKYGSPEAQIKEKLNYVGYFVPQEKMGIYNADGPVVIAGGGGIKKETSDFIERAIRAKAYASGELKAKTWTVYYDYSERDNIKGAVQETAQQLGQKEEDAFELLPTHSNFLDTMQEASLVISRGGTTSAEAVALGVPTVIAAYLPDMTYRKDTERKPWNRDEQAIRSEDLHEKAAKHGGFVQRLSEHECDTQYSNIPEEKEKFVKTIAAKADLASSADSPQRNSIVSILKNNGGPNAAEVIQRDFEGKEPALIAGK